MYNPKKLSNNNSALSGIPMNPPPQQPPEQPAASPVPLSVTPGNSRRIAIAVDLSEESAHAVRWAVKNYLRPGDSVILLHVRPTSVLYGADWGSIQPSLSAPSPNPSATAEQNQKTLEDDFDAFTATKAADLAKPLVEAQVPFKIHIVKDHDLKERLCLEVERLGICAVIMGSRGFGASRRRAGLGPLGSVSDYCVNHCVCPVVVVRHPEEKEAEPVAVLAKIKTVVAEETELHPVPEEELDASDEHQGSDEGNHKG